MNLKNIITTGLAFLCLAASGFSQIQAGKTLQIMAAGIPAEEKGRIDGIYPVADNGTINMPFINSVRAAGMKENELAASLQSRYKSEGIYTNIVIQVIATREGAGVAEEAVTVGGQVRRPGPVPFSKGLTLWMAVQAAGGPTEFGARGRVKLFRDGNSKSYDLAQPQFMRVPLQPDDTIDIPEKNILGR
jgi:polysaccharide export outer membrane protein